jgi:hypothetical protein
MFTDGDVENGQLLPQWTNASASEMDVAEVEVEGKGKAKVKDGIEQLERTPLEVFQPAEGSEGMEMMVNKALGLVFDAVKSI